MLLLNGERRWSNDYCQRCGYQSEILPYILYYSSPTLLLGSGDITALRVVRASRVPGEVRMNQRVLGVDEDLANLRPGIIMTHESTSIVVMIDITVPFENIFEALKQERLEKILAPRRLTE